MVSARVTFHCIFIIDLEKQAITYPLSLRRPWNGEDMTKVILYSIVFVTGTIGNGLVIRSFLQAVDKPGSRFVIALAVVDLIASVWVPFVSMSELAHNYKGHWSWGHTACVILIPWFPAAIWASAWLLVAISLERFRFVHFIFRIIII